VARIYFSSPQSSLASLAHFQAPLEEAPRLYKVPTLFLNYAVEVEDRGVLGEIRVGEEENFAGLWEGRGGVLLELFLSPED